MKDNLDFGLKDKVAIVAGGGSNGDGIGNGRASSILLAEAGAKVLVVDLNIKSAQNTVDLIKNNGGMHLLLMLIWLALLNARMLSMK